MAGYVHLTIKPRYCFFKIWIELLAAISYCSTLALDATRIHTKSTLSKLGGGQKVQATASLASFREMTTSRHFP